MARLSRSLATALGLVLLASVASAQDREKVLFRASLASAVVAHGMDLAETEYCLGAKTCRELNPWLLHFNSPSGFAIAKLSLATATLWATTAVYDRCASSTCRWLAIGLNVGQTVGFSLIARHNATHAR